MNDTLLSIMMFIFAVTCSVFVMQIINILPSKCSDKTVHTSMNLLLTLCVAMMGLPFSYLLCNWRGCIDQRNFVSPVINYFMSFISIVFIVNTIIVLSSLKKNDCYTTEIRNYLYGLMSINILLLLFLGFDLYQGSIIQKL